MSMRPGKRSLVFRLVDGGMLFVIIPFCQRFV